MLVAWDQESGHVGGEQQSFAGYILKMELIRFADGVDVDVRDNDDSKISGLSNWKSAIAFPELGNTMGIAGMEKIMHTCESVDTVRSQSTNLQ